MLVGRKAHCQLVLTRPCLHMVPSDHDDDLVTPDGHCPRTRSMGGTRFDATFPPLLASPTLLVPEWRNWQTRRTQNPKLRKQRGGSTPPSGTITSTSCAVPTSPPTTARLGDCAGTVRELARMALMCLRETDRMGTPGLEESAFTRLSQHSPLHRWGAIRRGAASAGSALWTHGVRGFMVTIGTGEVICRTNGSKIVYCTQTMPSTRARGYTRWERSWRDKFDAAKRF